MTQNYPVDSPTPTLTAVEPRQMSRADFVAAVLRNPLIEPCRESEFLSVASQASEVTHLVRECLHRALLTDFQAEWILQGRGAELVLGHCILTGRLGRGGMGEVFKARHRFLATTQAVKVIKPSLGNHHATFARFQREINALARLKHPNVVHVYDAGDEGRLYFVMEFVAGTDLGKRSGPLPLPLAIDYTRQAALGLQHAFEAGVVHRDIKPSNLLLGPNDLVKVADFGLALFQQASVLDSTFTPDSALMGTPDFIAPEQARHAHRVDIRADIYALGCSLYSLLTGTVPFPGGSVADKIERHQVEQPIPLPHLNPSIPIRLASIVERMMAKNPDERYQTPAEVATALGS